jgi:hypothetical protein
MGIEDWKGKTVRRFHHEGVVEAVRPTSQADVFVLYVRRKKDNKVVAWWTDQVQTLGG